MFFWLCLFVFIAMNLCLCIFQTASLFVSTSLYFSGSESCLSRCWLSVVGCWWAEVKRLLQKQLNTTNRGLVVLVLVLVVLVQVLVEVVLVLAAAHH